jgi:hypothetical protein
MLRTELYLQVDSEKKGNYAYDRRGLYQLATLPIEEDPQGQAQFNWD